MSVEKENSNPNWLIVGLGNPGRDYVQTRHNIGFLTADVLCQELGGVFKEETRWPGLSARIKTENSQIHLLKPTTFMNLCGPAVTRYQQYYRIPQEQLLIVSDDVDLPLGAMRVRLNGSAGGHNGLKSIIASLGTTEFARLRIGIGRQARGETADYVLGKFNSEETEMVEKIVSEAAKLLLQLPNSPRERMIEKFNSTKFLGKSYDNQTK